MVPSPNPKGSQVSAGHCHVLWLPPGYHARRAKLTRDRYKNVIWVTQYTTLRLTVTLQMDQRLRTEAGGTKMR